MTKKFAGNTHIFFVLDRSGSMQAVKDATISGFNEWLHTVQRESDGATFTLALFNTSVAVPVTSTPITDVLDLDAARYVPTGMTALYDAIAQAVRAGEEQVKKKDRALVVVMTDGQENSSREITRKALNALIKEKEGSGNWTFTYLSAHPEAFADSAAIGIQRGNVGAYAATEQGTRSSMGQMTNHTVHFLGGASGQSTSFYSPDDIQGEVDEKAAKWTADRG